MQDRFARTRSRLIFSSAGHEQHKAADYRNRSHNRGQRERFSLLRRHMDRTDIHNFFPGGVSKALIGKG